LNNDYDDNNNNNKDLTIEIQRMWNVKTRVIPVIIGATGTISKSFRKYVSTILGNHDVRELQKTAILGTAESADVKVHYRVNTGTSDMGTINSSDRMTVTLYCLGTGFCLRNICINTLHKGDSDNNNNK
jgi:hypothetical protein